MGATLKSANKNRVMDCVVEVEFYILRSSEGERERERSGRFISYCAFAIFYDKFDWIERDTHHKSPQKEDHRCNPVHDYNVFTIIYSRGAAVSISSLFCCDSLSQSSLRLRVPASILYRMGMVIRPTVQHRISPLSTPTLPHPLSRFSLLFVALAWAVGEWAGRGSCTLHAPHTTTHALC